MTGPLLKNFGEMAEVATSVGRALQNRRQAGNPNDGFYTTASLDVSGTRVSHNLGRPPDGWVVIDNDADARVWRSGEMDSSSITLSASAAANVRLWIF